MPLFSWRRPKTTRTWWPAKSFPKYNRSTARWYFKHKDVPNHHIVHDDDDVGRFVVVSRGGARAVTADVVSRIHQLMRANLMETLDILLAMKLVHYKGADNQLVADHRAVLSFFSDWHVARVGAGPDAGGTSNAACS